MFTLYYFFRVVWYAVPVMLAWRTPRKYEKVGAALRYLGPSFVKLGQTLSVRPDVVGEPMAAELAKLRDRMPPLPAGVAVGVLERELGQSVQTLFLEFNPVPVAAASIAQVHRARTLDGFEVAVKILRPGVAEAFARDIQFFYKASTILEFFLPSARRLKPAEAIKLFEDGVRRELDMRLEAAAASELRENMKNDPHVHVPRVFRRFSNEHILVTEWADGIPIDDVAALEAAGHSRAELAARLAVMFFNQAYRDGYFHADMHPGNLFVNAKGQIVPVDFGIMGRLDEPTRVFVAEILRGFVTGDYMHVARIHVAAGYVPRGTDPGDFALACRAIGEPILGKSADEISVAKLLGLLFKITEQFRMETQPQLLLFQKTLVLVEGVGHALYPKVNLWQLAEPWIAEWARDHFGVRGRVRRIRRDWASASYRLPEAMARFERLLSETADGGVRLHPETVKLQAELEGREQRKTIAFAAALAAAAAAALRFFP